MVFVGAPLGPVGSQRSPTISRLGEGLAHRAVRRGKVAQRWENWSKLTIIAEQFNTAVRV